MKSLIHSIIAFIALSFHWLRGEVMAANTYDAAVETHDATVRRTNDDAITARHLLWTQGSTDGGVKLATAVLPALGTIDNTEASTGVGQTVLMLGKGPTKKMVASGAIAAGATVYQAASGKGSATGVIAVGTALTATANDTEILEVADFAPVGPVVTASTTTVAADALAIPITHRTVSKATGGDAEALTLADGAFLGQQLQIFLATDGGGDGTLTPTTKSGFSTIVFADKGDNVNLEWTTSGWIITGSAGIAAPPVISLA
jgi:hypothetical protein